MIEEVFTLVCGRASDHLWAPGGALLPFCQRCTGLYVGAALALALEVIFRSRPSPRRLQLYGLCLLQMVPFGFHLVPHGPVLRTTTGLLFGFGLVGFLGLQPAAKLGWHDVGSSSRRLWLHPVTALACLATVLFSASHGGVAAARALSWLGFAGLVALALLIAVNLAFCGRWLVPQWRRRSKPLPS